MEKLFRYPLENLQHHWFNNLRKNLNKLHGSQYPVAQCSLFKFVHIESDLCTCQDMKHNEMVPTRDTEISLHIGAPCTSEAGGGAGHNSKFQPLQLALASHTKYVETNEI